MFVVKYACTKGGCACGISELVCTQLLAKVGVRTLSQCVVKVNPGFAATVNIYAGIDAISTGGTGFAIMSNE